MIVGEQYGLTLSHILVQCNRILNRANGLPLAIAGNKFFVMVTVYISVSCKDNEIRGSFAPHFMGTEKVDKGKCLFKGTHERCQVPAVVLVVIRNINYVNPILFKMGLYQFVKLQRSEMIGRGLVIKNIADDNIVPIFSGSTNKEPACILVGGFDTGVLR